MRPTSEQHMNSKERAVNVIADKLWITYNKEGSKTGTITQSNSVFSWFKTNGDRHDIQSITDMFDVEEKQEELCHTQFVFGYPAIDANTFKHQEKDNLPCFTKTETSKTYYAAGYYVVFFPNTGWTGSFCPKISTLRKYKFVGPFKTNDDKTVILNKKRREQI